MTHSHNIADNDKRFIINPDTRAVRSLTRTVVAWMDHNSEYLTFEIPRYVEGHDITLCNNVEIHYRNFGDEGEKFGLYTVTDLQINPKDENTMLFSWLISQNATSIIGRIAFVIRFQCLKDAEILYSWSTVICESVVVSDSIYTTEKIVEQYADVLEQWKLQFDRPVSPEEIDDAIRDYLEENPIDVDNAVTYTPQTLTEEQQAQVRKNIGAIGTTQLVDSVNNALTQAKESGEFDGKDGDPGATPHIGENGNWFISETDTGVKASGENGKPGDNYILTVADKSEIAEEAADLIEIPQIDATLTQEGYAADAKAVGDALVDRLSVKQGIENAGKLLFVNADGTIAPLMIGAGLKIQNGVLIITNAAVTAAVCGEFLCGEVVCGGTR